jgi:hypothetical protein
MDNNLLDAINRMFGYTEKNGELRDGVSYMDADDRTKCGL